MPKPLRLGVNLDHVATLRNARGGTEPNLLRAADQAYEAGAAGITLHLREDRRHIRDADVWAVRNWGRLPLNLEIAATPEMQRIAADIHPERVCIVPEKREELTTEGGLDLSADSVGVERFVRAMQAVGIGVSLFVDPSPAAIQNAAALNADCVELHSGAYAEACTAGAGEEAELRRLVEAASQAEALGLEVHAGHGLSTGNVGPIAAILPVEELNIGHFLVGEALFVGLSQSIAEMLRVMQAARKA